MIKDRINITRQLDYKTLDDVINYLNELRNEHGGDSRVDIYTSHAEYTGDAEAKVVLIINQK